MKKNSQYEEIFNETNGSTSLPNMYLKEKKRREDIEKRYNMLVNLLKQEGCNKVSQRIRDELEAQKRLH